jgi:hypothetical protein
MRHSTIYFAFSTGKGSYINVFKVNITSFFNSFSFWMSWTDGYVSTMASGQLFSPWQLWSLWLINRTVRSLSNTFCWMNSSVSRHMIGIQAYTWNPCGIFQPRRMDVEKRTIHSTWRLLSSTHRRENLKSYLFIQQNVLLCDLAILFISQTLQRLTSQITTTNVAICYTNWGFEPALLSANCIRSENSQMSKSCLTLKWYKILI